MAGNPARLLAVGVLLSCLGAGCSSMARMPLDEFLPPPTRDGASGRQGKIAGYTTDDGAYHEFDGVLVAFSPDSLRFVLPAPGWDRPAAGEAFEKPRSDVATVLVKRGDTAKTLALTAGLLSGALVGFGILLAASWD